MVDQDYTQTPTHLDDLVAEGGAAYKSEDVQQVIATAGTVFNETKAGWKTTEFWLTVAGLVAVNAGDLVMTLPDKYQALASAALAGLYALSRGVAKKGIPDVKSKPEA